MTTRRPEDRPYFFDAGLRFDNDVCASCGRCCTGEPGTVFMNRATAERIATFLKMDCDVFLERYAYPFRTGHSLKEKENGDCILYENGRCTIYPVRPTQCRTYPFWPESVRSEAAWKRTAKACPGVGKGRLYSREEILKLVGETIEDDR
ncbi:MAG: YkgJ family cysteine cluster protein [Kiritimatiellae bacterium]|nr:YkgJ family cysteine cluster protein [Kiritimatiellia bacterium]MCO5061050.1 YkgJ family cysteine cluster protein [Kiritimatiellia bacterium]MCO6400060.1 YkgJ family cysteine cluster protein [Verrucomicrobiota bacterium]